MSYPSVLVATACGGEDASTSTSDSGEKLDKVTLTLNWYPYGEHAPFYYGKQQKIFEKHGIDLDIRPGQGSQKTVQATAAGRDRLRLGRHAGPARRCRPGREGEEPRRLPPDDPGSVQSFDARGHRGAAT